MDEKDTMICTNEKCQKEFEIQETDSTMPGCKTEEEIICPYCHNLCGTRSVNGVIRTFKLD